MTYLRFCRACAGARPRAARRCPWCLKDYALPLSRVERPGSALPKECSP